MDKELTVLVERLKRVFPDLVLYNEGHYIDINENDYYPTCDVDWYYIIKTLEENGLEIKNIK